MLVADLIRELHKYPPEWPVFSGAYGRNVVVVQSTIKHPPERRGQQSIIIDSVADCPVLKETL